MSYILEALKKDEANSDPQAAATLALARSQPNRSWLLWLIVAALLINATVLGYLFWPQAQNTQSPSLFGGSEPPVTQAGARRELQVKPRQRVAPPGSVPRARPSAAPRSQSPAPELVITPSNSRTPADPATAAAATAAPATEAVSLPATDNTTRGRVLSPEQAAELNLLPTETDRTAAARPQQAATGNTIIAPTPRSTEAAVENPPKVDPRRKRVIQLAELPPKDRQDFPKLEFSTHIFADDPALRAVVVNSKRLNEGESIGEMVLRAVTEDGILVDYRGYRVAVSVIEEWKEP